MKKVLFWPWARAYTHTHTHTQEWQEFDRLISETKWCAGGQIQEKQRQPFCHTIICLQENRCFWLLWLDFEVFNEQ